MDKLVKGFLKISRLIVVICLFILAAFQIVALLDSFGGPFMNSVYHVLRTILLLLLYLVPAILVATKKDKQGFIVLAFLLGYLVLTGAINFLEYARGINGDNKALYVVECVFGFILGILLTISICCFLFDKGFGTKLMKFGNLILVLCMLVTIVFVVIDLIFVLVEGMEFSIFLKSLGMELIVPCIIVFGLLLVGNE